ncbi:FmdC precursor [Minicystis rosea]|nr:FmdC precursor [Minicystis rosea]
MMRSLRTAALTLIVGLGAVAPAAAQEAATKGAAKKTVEQPAGADAAKDDASPKQGATAKQDEAPKPGAAPAERSSFSLSAAPGKGFTIATTDGRFSSTWRARIQIRDTVTHDASGTTNEINVKTVRLWTYGHVLVPELRYGVQLAFGGNDFEKDNYSPIFDAYVEYVKLRDLEVRVGQFFVPFDRARTIREFALELVDRPNMVRELSLDRDVGLMLSSSNLFGSHNILGYNLFIGSGDGRNRFGGTKPGPLALLRLTVRPFGTFDDDQEGDLARERRPRLALGFAGGYNYRTNRANSTYGSNLAVGTTNYIHGAADLVFKYGGFSVLAEGLVRKASTEHITGEVDGKPAEAWGRSGYGSLLQLGMMVHRLVQVVGRWEQLFAMKGTDPALIQTANTQGRQLGGGLNVYLNGHAFKLQSDYHYLFGPEAAEGKHMVRFQVDATF